MVDSTTHSHLLSGPRQVVHSSNFSDITRPPTTTTESHVAQPGAHSTFHIYHKKEGGDRLISPVIDPSKERRWGPTVAESKAERNHDRALVKEGPAVEEADDDGSFFLHTPYLAFHNPPRVLYAGPSRHANPAVLIHGSSCWRKWKLQLGPSIALPGVLDPRGVVSWKHNGGNKQALKSDDRLLQGYKVGTWRLWGETGKTYVHNVNANRKAGTGVDPDVPQDDNLDPTDVESKSEAEEREGHGPVLADEVVTLSWTNPLSRHSRRYHFQYNDIDFYWKGTGTVRESRSCGFFIRYNHLKLIARLPSTASDEPDQPEVCLGKYTCSVASRKSGTLEIYDAVILRLAMQHMPSVLPLEPFNDRMDDSMGEDNNNKVEALKKAPLYHVILATAMCMIIGEKEKRQTVQQIFQGAGEAGGGG
ncbi:hypothetical protein BDV95DRAFT_666400 [Massariosphaeria phaeospora]|uniref:Uncharacterized protein n=1 Tax=Massariosphaeria phaeospora TaxID=100035 RepID=A0A7C8IAB3_9PLEO|nr:hypothetical protein BDV95DRAFT_666400 [Massariosphaeria phaeospora]